ncbi:uncharacterized protein LOC131321143 [Rhododendron vialii]|uniref:uncharacterized protein LOC131321143 n=1 Tax=Rhododendron vialii TaxID=182163 RepID=UPI00265F448F|nr:uncharacterized protein LOC131321143 [Rhododendron vialii]
MIKETTENMKTIRQRLFEAQKRTTEQVKVIRQSIATSRLVTFWEEGKAFTAYIGPFDVIEKIGEVAYRLALPPRLSNVHDVFHVSMLRKYEPDPSHVLEWSEFELEANASYGEEPICILDTHDQVLRGKTIPLVRVLWKSQGSEESTWEREDEIREKYPYLFSE